MDQIKIGQFIAAQRKETGLTQIQLAEKLGVTNKAVSKWENGKCLPDASLFTEICLLLNITINEFFAGEKLTPEQVVTKSEENLVELISDYQNRDQSSLFHMTLFGLGIGMIIASIAISHFFFKICWFFIAFSLIFLSYLKLSILNERFLMIAKIISLITFGVCIVCTIDLGINYANALLVEYHDGIILTGILSRLIYSDHGWSLPSFFSSFNTMLIVSTMIFIENIILACISIIKKK